MSVARRYALSRARFAALIIAVIGLSGSACWEQVDPDWFSQMKEQPALQALEHVTPLVPPEGTIPVGGIEPRIAATNPMPIMDPLALLANPIAVDETSLARGQQVYQTYCTVCHGRKGLMADGATVGPRVAAIPLAAVGRLTDGQIFTKIRYGKPLMPGYPQIPSADRWHVVNYLTHKLFPRPGGTGE